MDDTQGIILFAFLICVCPITIVWIGWLISEKCKQIKHPQKNNLEVLNVTY